MQGQSQDTCYPFAEARVSAPALQLRVTNGSLPAPEPAYKPSTTEFLVPAGRRVAFAARTCPCCDRDPVEPVHLDGHAVCRGCTASCGVCTGTCLPGDGICRECVRHLYPLEGVA